MLHRRASSLGPIQWPHATRADSALRRGALAIMMAGRVTLRSVDRAAVADTATTRSRCATVHIEVVSLGPPRLPPWLVLDRHLIDPPFVHIHLQELFSVQPDGVLALVPACCPTSCWTGLSSWSANNARIHRRRPRARGARNMLLAAVGASSRPAVVRSDWGMGSPGPNFPPQPFLQWTFAPLLPSAHHGGCPWVPPSARNSVTLSGR